MTWEQLADRKQNGLAGGLPAIVEAAQSLACPLYRNFPKFVGSDPTGFGSALSGVWDKLCPKDFPKNPPGAAGVCSTSYLVRIPVQNSFSGGTEPNEVYSFGVNSFGSPSFTPSTSQVNYVVTNQDGTTANQSSTYGSFRSWKQEYGQPTIVSATPSPSCPPNYAPPTPQLPSSPSPGGSDLQINVPVQVTPTLIAPVTLVYVRPTAIVNVNAPVSVDFRPTIQLPDFNLELRFDGGGITINNYGGGNSAPISPSPDPRPNPPSPSKPPPVDCDNGSPPADLTEILDLLEDIEDCACKPEQTIQTMFLGGGDSGSYSLPSQCIGVELNLIQVNQSAKFESGLAAPDVYYAGWSSFGRGVGRDIRNPISYLFNWYKCQPEYDRFSFTCRIGYEAQAIAYYLVNS